VTANVDHSQISPIVSRMRLFKNAGGEYLIHRGGSVDQSLGQNSVDSIQLSQEVIAEEESVYQTTQ